MAVVGENHSLQISTRTLSKAWALTAVCWRGLGGGGGTASSRFVLDGANALLTLSNFNDTWWEDS